MGNFNPRNCKIDIDFARGFAFMLEVGRQLDPGPTRNMYQIMLRSVTYGGMILYEDEMGCVVAIACYSIGTERNDFQDQDTVHVDYILMKSHIQRTFYFLKCMEYFADTISTRYPEVKFVTMEAEASSTRNNRLYSKFAHLTETIRGDLDKLHVYRTTLRDFSSYAKKLVNARKKDD